MIAKGLKVGDTFEDGGVTHKILEVVGENYISEVIDKPKTFTVVQNDYNAIPYAQLKKMCAEKGLDATGTKSDLIARLEG